ncbi:MAG: penicillin-binding transpeptidase domain-containing protein [Oscillospiraceae bacterium]|nr:penicillin-binding transpeptidase domain-containing protein [Oscillospiraceae bacterium]
MSDGKKTETNSLKLNKMMIRRTLFLFIVCGIVAFAVLAVRLYQLQISEHDYYAGRSISQQIRQTTITAGRGSIYDRNMKILAMSAEVETIYISPAEMKIYNEDPMLAARVLSDILGVDYNSIIEKTIDEKSWYKIIKTKVEKNVADQVREFIDEYNLIGVKIGPDSKRYYPYGSLASHLIGFVGEENYGLGGAELYYNSMLTGTDGRVVRVQNAAGTDMLFTEYEDYYAAEDGCDVVLTIDSTIQYYLEKHLIRATEDYGVQNGAACIAVNPKTGEILGMVSLDNFDLNNFQDVSEKTKELMENTLDDKTRGSLLTQAQQMQWRNKAISDTYEPGSTFKAITLAMALQEGLIGKDDFFYCGGFADVTGRDDPVNCWNTFGHGSQTLTQAVQHSCNLAFVNIGLRLTPMTFYKYAEAFGFFDSGSNPDLQLTGMTGIDLEGESGSIWWPQNVFCDRRNLSQLAAASFGQTFNVTPLQLITAVSACVNGGYLMKPYTVKEIIAPDGNTISRVDPTVIRQVISEETSALVCEMLEQVVCDKEEGTGKNAYVAGYRIGGKTGTTTKTTREIVSGEKEYIVSFFGAAPINDPQIVILVLLDNPSEEGIYVSGGQMGAPTVGKMMADILPYLGVDVKYTEEEVYEMDKTVPDLTGMSVSEAAAVLSARGLSLRTVGSGYTVTFQLPAAKQAVAKDSQIILYLDAEPSDQTEEMPDLTGLSYSIARQRMGYYGLFIQIDGGSVPSAGNVSVSSQNVEAGTEIEHGTVVRVVLKDTDPGMYGRY